MVRYYKKYDTRIRINTGAGFQIPFTEIFDDHQNLYEWGVFATQDQYMIGELQKLMERQVGGVTEISGDEYEALKKKERQKLFPFWRETLYPKALFRQLQNAAEDVAAAARRARLPEVVRQMRTEAQHLSRPLGTLNWRPKAVTN